MLLIIVYLLPHLIELLIDNGGGMNPDKVRHCMSLGYSAKSKVKNTIGQCKLIVLNSICYLLTTTQHRHLVCLLCFFADGNGFKTSTMRLGADVLVFSRSHGIQGTRLSSLPGNIVEVFLSYH